MTERMPYNVLALDLDGTLTNSDKKLSEKNKTTIWKAIDKGVTVIIASGRPVLGIQPIADELELNLRGGYIMAYNGGKVIDCKSKSIIYQHLIPEDIISDLVDTVKQTKLTLLTYNDEGIITEGPVNEYVVRESMNNSIPIQIIPDMVDAVKHPVEKFMAVGKPEDVSDVLSKLQEKYSRVLNIFCSEPYFVEIMPSGIEKSISMDKVLSILNLDREQLIMCGDGLNDISLIKYAGLGVAMANAYDDVKSVADVITLSNDDDGVAKVIEDYILK